MRINAINAHEASKQILRVIFAADYNQSRYRASQYGYTFVYYSPSTARFSFETQQRKNFEGLIKRYEKLDSDDVINTTAYKYSFSQIAIGAILSRKIMRYRKFFDLVRVHYDWVG